MNVVQWSLVSNDIDMVLEKKKKGGGVVTFLFVFQWLSIKQKRRNVQQKLGKKKINLFMRRYFPANIHRYVCIFSM